VRRVAFALSFAVLVGGVALGAPFLRGPYSGAPGDDGITVSWRSTTPLAVRVEYGPLADYASDPRFPHSVEVPAPAEDVQATTHIVLRGLPLATECVYRVVLLDGEEEVTSPVGSFRTKPSVGDAVGFAVIADTQHQSTGSNRLQMIGDAVAADPADLDFVLHAGDVVESPSSEVWDHWFRSFGAMLLRAPFIPVLGNHENGDPSYYEAFELPPGGGRNDERWWALHWGDVVVVGLDTTARRAADIEAQQAWIREHLAGPEPHRFVIFHHPVFSSDPEHGASHAFDALYHPLLVEMDVDVVFNGHSHHYERIARDGVTYLVVGGGGAIPRGIAAEPIEGSVVSTEGHHFYVRVATSEAGIRVETVSVARETPAGTLITDSRLLDGFKLPFSAAGGSAVLGSIWIIASGATLCGILIVLGTAFCLRHRRARRYAAD